MRLTAHRTLALALGLAGLAAASPAAAPRPQASSSSRAGAKPAAVAPLTVAELAPRKAYGSPKAPIRMDVFTDYQCPSCKAFFDESWQPLLENYISTGKVYFVHHDFPIHNHAREAARWADAAAIAGYFPAMEKALYSTQNEWGATGNIQASLAKVLSPAILSKVRAVQSAPHPEIDASIDADQALGKAKEIPGTPGIIITHNGQSTMLPNTVPDYALLKAYLDSLLSRR